MRELGLAFMMALFLTLLSVRVEAQVEEFVPYTPDSSQVGLICWEQSGVSYINITIEFPDTGFHISSWGTPNTTGNNISVDAGIWRWTGLSFPVITTVSHTYNLGDLLYGEYNFFFETWGSPLRNTTFLVSPEIIVPDDYSSIQEAINAANEGDTIFVSSGIYYENVVVNKTVSLVGEDKSNTIIDGNYSGTVVHITAHDVSLTGFTIRNAGEYGIRIYYSNNSTLTDNIVITHNWYEVGIMIYWSNSCFVSGNDVSGGWAIALVGSYNSKVTENVVFSKGKYGIRLGWSHGNLVAYNTILNATAGPPLAPSWGLWSSYYSTDNIIHHNNFLNNTNQAHGHNLTNFWDNGCEGNYWSDYNGTDLYGDGIGDTPYVIDVNNTDNYPLMKPFWDLGDIDNDMDVDIFDIVLAAGAYGSTPSDPNWNPHCDIAEPYGKIDIFDIVTIAGSYGKEYSP